jgi:hypothetical protein
MSCKPCLGFSDGTCVASSLLVSSPQSIMCNLYYSTGSKSDIASGFSDKALELVTPLQEEDSELLVSPLLRVPVQAAGIRPIFNPGSGTCKTWRRKQ